MPSYTPGPWLYGYGGGNHLDPDHSTVFDGSTPHACIAFTINSGLRKNKANARLICAAPDLVDALNFLIRASERICDELEKQGTKPNMARDALRQAKRTIWNATGKKYDKKTTA
jgi:hypothetical protein